jgi:glycerol uptake facilitator-like aquaporin
MYHKLIGEFVGSLFLVFLVIAIGGNYLMIGCALALLVLILGKVTGAAVNPAVALAFYQSGKLNQGELFGYILVEMLGGYVGYMLATKGTLGNLGLM